MPTTTMAVSSSQNSTSSVVTTQIISDATLASEKTDDDSSDILKATVNGNNNNNNIKNGAISSLLTGEHCSPKITLHSPISIRTNVTNDIDIELNIKPTDVNCLNVVTSSPNSASTNNFLNNSNGHMLMEQSSGINFQTAVPENSPLVITDWSIGDDNCGTNNSFANYSSQNNGQILKRSIANPQMHHGLSPNSNVSRNNMQQQQQQYIHSNKNNNSGNNFPQWSNNNAPNSSWQHQIPLHQPTSTSQVPMNQVSWNRGGRAGGNQHSSHALNQQQQLYQRKQFPISSVASSSQQQSSQGGLSPNMNTSPTKYRRNHSYPGKNQMHGFNMDVNSINDEQHYMNYNVSFSTLLYL